MKTMAELADELRTAVPDAEYAEAGDAGCPSCDTDAHAVLQVIRELEQ